MTYTVSVIEEVELTAGGVLVVANSDTVTAGPFSVGVSEALFVYLETTPDLGVSVSDTTTLADTVIDVVNSTGYRYMSSTVTVSESVAIALDNSTVGTSDSTTLSESVKALLEALLDTSSAITVSDTATVALGDLAVGVSDTVTTTDLPHWHVGTIYPVKSFSVNANQDIVLDTPVRRSLRFKVKVKK